MARVWRAWRPIVGAGIGAGFLARGVAARADAPPAGGAEEGADGDHEVVLLQVIFRHGARTPLRTMLGQSDLGADWAFCDPGRKQDLTAAVEIKGVGDDTPGEVKNLDAEEKHRLRGGCLPGELTELGCQQMKSLGESLREKYVDQLQFLSGGFSDEEVGVRSTVQERAVESVRSLLAGLYPTGTRPERVPVHIKHKEKETIVPNTLRCPRLRTMFREARTHWANNDETHEVRTHLGLLLGEDIYVTPILHFYDNLAGRQAHGLEVPAELSPQLIDQVKRLAAWEVDQLFNEDESLKLSIAPLWSEIQMNFENKLNNVDSEKKLYLFSGHDTTLMPMLVSLGTYDGTWPPFASNIVVELLRDRKSREPFVRVFFNDEPQGLPGCGGKTICPYEDFVKLLGDMGTHPAPGECQDVSTDHGSAKIATTFD